MTNDGITPYQRMLRAMTMQPGDEVPACLWAIGQTYAPFAGIPDHQYYDDPAKMLAAQVAFYEQFPDVFTVPGIWPDMGLVPEAGALGCEVEFLKTSPPHIRRPALQDIDEAPAFTPPDPRQAPYTSQVLQNLRYFAAHLGREPRDKFGFLDGHLFLGGPGEVTALLLGYDKYAYALADKPELVHALTRKVTDFLKRYVDAQVEIVGHPRRVIIWDHLPGMLSLRTYAEFVHPYLKELFAYVAEAEIRIYHNENNYPHLLGVMKEIPATVFHIGPRHDIAATKRALGKCVMGNVHPINELLDGSEEDIVARCRQIIETAGTGGGLWLSTAGGMAPETPVERMRILVETAKACRL